MDVLIFKIIFKQYKMFILLAHFVIHCSEILSFHGILNLCFSHKSFPLVNTLSNSSNSFLFNKSSLDLDESTFPPSLLSLLSFLILKMYFKTVNLYLHPFNKEVLITLGVYQFLKFLKAK